MKRRVLIIVAFLLTVTVSAKKVKFEVDMTDQTVSGYGVHVSGDFQDEAGYPGGDWQPGTTELINEPGTQIYSVVVDIPAFAKYEYKFLNGDQWYDSEFVPWESRVGYNFNDNRWIFIDSIANDTSTTMPILFGGNAPAGLKLLRFKVDMQKELSINPEGVHVAGSFQDWNPLVCRLYDFDTTIFEYMAYVEQGYFEYKYYNGNLFSSAENVPQECAVNNNRYVNIVNDTILDAVCFSECSACVITQISKEPLCEKISVYPNPTSSVISMKFSDKSTIYKILITDMKGQIIREFISFNTKGVIIELPELKKGVYLIISKNEFEQETISKLVVK